MEWMAVLQGYVDDFASRPGAPELGIAVMVGVAAFTLVVALMLLAAGFADPVRRRLHGLTADEREPKAGDPGLVRVFAPVGDYLAPRDKAARSKVAKRLSHGGARKPNAVRVFYGAKLSLAVLLPVITIATLIPLARVPVSGMLLYVVAAAIAGFLIPTFWLEHRIKRRVRNLRRGLPDALDLLVVCTEAGLGLGAAIQRVARDLEVSHPELAEEWRLFGMQTRAGMDTRSALRDLEERNGVDDIRGLVTTLLQSMRFGTSIADTLRIYSTELRDKRTQAAEERAAKVGTKMLFPLVLFIFPSFFVVALGPPLLGALAALGAR